MVNLFYGSFKSANPHHHIIFSLSNEKTMRQKELDYACNRKELPTFLPDRKDFDFNEPRAVLLVQFCQRFAERASPRPSLILILTLTRTES